MPVLLVVVASLHVLVLVLLKVALSQKDLIKVNVLTLQCFHFLKNLQLSCQISCILAFPQKF